MWCRARISVAFTLEFLQQQRTRRRQSDCVYELQGYASLYLYKYKIYPLNAGEGANVCPCAPACMSIVLYRLVDGPRL